ncbi:MAG TPA: argininosuccinate lyase [Clostridia bacterium]|nr:argininosuccinate lyase [Clostridia bacterium]
MEKLWTGRFSKPLDKIVSEFNSSISVDGRMYKEDILGSIAHVKMLANQGIIAAGEAEKIATELAKISEEIEAGELEIDSDAEDIHSFIEGELTRRLGESGKRLHTARSRNDQVATDTRLYVKGKVSQISDALKSLIGTLCELAEGHKDTIMAGYTHLQMAQPITFGSHLMAYAFMFVRDLGRLTDCRNRMDYSPLGSCALAGTTFNIDRQATAKTLGFRGITENSLDGVSDRDYCIELASAIAIIMTHLSRFSEEIILWCSWEFKYIELDDAYATGSSIMPQKKNPDIAELVRGKTGRAYGNLITLLTMMKGLPLAYNKDMQEDKEALFDSIDTVSDCLRVFTDMLATMTVLKGNMAKAAEKGFINATDCADYLVKKGLPFRSAYKITGEIVAYCIQNGKSLNALTIEEYKGFTELFEGDIYAAIDLKTCVMSRKSEGGPAPESVMAQIAKCRAALSKYEIKDTDN